MSNIKVCTARKVQDTQENKTKIPPRTCRGGKDLFRIDFYRSNCHELVIEIEEDGHTAHREDDLICGCERLKKLYVSCR